MSRLQKDFTIPSVACASQEDQENMTLKVTLLSSEWKSSTNGDLSTINRELAIQLAKHPDVDVSVLIPNCSEVDRSSAKSHSVKLVEADRVPGYDPVLCLSFPPTDHTMDCVIGHGVHLGRPIASIKRNPNYSHCKWIQVVHSVPEEDGMFKDISEGQKMQETEIQLCKMADQVITIGPKLAEAYKCYLCPVKQEEKVFDLTPSIFSEFLVVEQATEERRTFGILVVGSGDSCEDFNVKGYDVAAKAIAELKDESYKLKFVCAGGGKGDIVAEKLLHDGIGRNQLIVRSFDDNREVLANLFCEVDLAIMPSRTEGFGITALEALSAGLPVLVSGNSGLGEALKKVPLGSQSVVDSDNPKDWAKEIKHVRQKERGVRLSESRLLREKYLEKYSWEEPCKSLVIKMKNLVFGKAPHSSLDCEETERNKQGESIPGAAAYVSRKQAQRNTKEVWTATGTAVEEKAPNTSLKRRRTDGNEQTKSVQEGQKKEENSKEKEGTAKGKAEEKTKESGDQVVRRTSNKNGWFNKIIMMTIMGIIILLFLFAENGGREAGSGDQVVKWTNNKYGWFIKIIMMTILGIIIPLFLFAENGGREAGGTSMNKGNKKGDSDITPPSASYVDFRDAIGGTPLMGAAFKGKVQVVKSLIERGADPSLMDNRGWNSLHFAANGGDADIIDLIHTQVPNIESKTGDGCTPLMIAACNSKLHAVKWFLEKGATVTREDNSGANALHFAAEGGDTDIIDLIHTHLLNIESKTNEGRTPLMVAARRGKLQAVKWFLEKGATVNCDDNHGRNTLHFAAEGGDTDIIDLIHTHLLNIELKTGEGHTPLMVAAGSGKLQAVNWFLEKGATVPCEDNRGWNTLHIATSSGDTDIIDLIHTRLPNVDSKTNEGYTPLMVAAFNGKLPVVKWFLEKGATVTLKDRAGWNMLHFAAQGGDTDILDLIHNHVPNIESRSLAGITPLMVAVGNCKLHAVQWFIEKGASVACVDENGCNILHFAAKNCDPDVIHRILTYVPDIESKTAFGETPLIIAVRHGKLQSVKYLLERGANPLAKDNNGRGSLYHASSQDADFLNLLQSHVANSESTTGND